MKRKAILKRIAGSILLLLSFATVFVWFVWLAPLRHLSSPDWLQNHKPKQIWLEVQKEMKNGAGYSHVSRSCLEMWGDKESAAWLISQFKAGRELMDCADGHLGAAMPFITNQELGWDTNAWIAWWSTNGNKTQEEWIRDGFAKRGLPLSRNLSTNDILALLKIIGAPPSKTNDLATTFSAGYRYNAFRWLRDAGIDPKSVGYESLPASDKNIVIRGLILYSQNLGAFDEHPGRIFKADSDQTGYQPWFTNWKTELGVGLVAVLIGLTGLYLALHREAK